MTETEKKQFWKANIRPALEKIKTMNLLESITIPGYVENSGCILTKLPGGVCELQTETETHLVAFRNVCADIDVEINTLGQETEMEKLESIIIEKKRKENESRTIQEEG